MRRQLLRLVEMSRQPRVAIRILPFDATTYVTASFGFIALGYGDDIGSDVIYLEDYTGAVYLDRPDTVRIYTQLWQRLHAAALDPTPSRRLIERISAGLDHSCLC